MITLVDLQKSLVLDLFLRTDEKGGGVTLPKYGVVAFSDFRKHSSYNAI